MKLPVLVAYDVKLGELHKNQIRIDAPLKLFMIKFGIGGVPGIDAKRSQLWLQSGTVTFKGKATFAQGSSIRNNGELVFGDCFSGGKNIFISCTKQIVFGNDILTGWNCAIRDSDGHTLIYNGEPKEAFKPVYIGNHVWIAAETHVLKGVKILDNSVVAYRSLVVSAFDEEGILIGGSPAKKLQESVNWER
jgi:acetyltransferase-like isoleucine patch superfamily enzyme